MSGWLRGAGQGLLLVLLLTAGAAGLFFAADHFLFQVGQPLFGNLHFQFGVFAGLALRFPLGLQFRFDTLGAPAGFETRREAQLRMLQEQYGHGASGDRAHLVGADSEDAANAVLTATSDLRLFFQLTAESFGWGPERPMPYGNVRNPDGTFTPITDVEIALDATEIKRKAAQAKRKEKNRATLSAAALAAQAILAKALDSKKVHLKR